MHFFLKSVLIRFFTSMQSSIFDLATIKSFLSLMDNFNPSLNVQEVVTYSERDEAVQFWDAIMATQVMIQSYTELNNFSKCFLTHLLSTWRKVWMCVHCQKYIAFCNRVCGPPQGGGRGHRLHQYRRKLSYAVSTLSSMKHFSPHEKSECVFIV